MGGGGCKPCCFCSNQIGCRIIGILQILGSIYSLYVGGAGIDGITLLKQIAEKKREFPLIYDVILATFILIVILAFVSLFLGIILIIGANGDAGKCKIWIYCTIVLLILDIIIQIVLGIYYDNYKLQLQIIVCIISVIVKVYFIWVVDSYLKDLRTPNRNAM